MFGLLNLTPAKLGMCAGASVRNRSIGNVTPVIDGMS